MKLAGKLTALGLALASISGAVSAAQDFSNLSWQQAQAKLVSGEITSAELVAYYQQRIKTLDQASDSTNSISQLSPEALAQARQLDAERAQGKVRGPLHGIPVVLKDNIDTGDGMSNSAGSLALKNNVPADDAFLVARLREAGAIILGKTNLSEWANFRSSRSSSGWSGMYGQTRNAYDLNRSPCGSSSGSGVAVAADFTLLAVGTETDGSVTCPSSINGIVGIKPTLGLVSRDGIIPISHSQDTAGPMARTVAGAVALLQAMAVYDGNDAQAEKGQMDYLRHLKADGLKGKRIGVVRQLGGYHDDVDALFEQQLAVLKAQGAIIVDNVELADYESWGDLEYKILLQEFKPDLEAYLATTGDGVPKTMQALIAFNQSHAEQEMPYFRQEIFEAAMTPPFSPEEYQRKLSALKKMAQADGIDAALSQHKLDMLIAPSNQAAWSIDHINGDNYLGAASSPAAIAGYPHITVPMGYIQGMPVGLSFFAGKLAEPVLIEAAYGFEQATLVRRPPAIAN